MSSYKVIMMRTSVFVVSIGAVLLAGCTTPGDLQGGSPTINASSNKAPKQYALCVMPKWQDARSGATMTETSTGYRLIVATDSTTEELLEVNRSPNGSSVALYQRLSWAPGYGRSAIEKAVRDCL
ncbi:hypothetical protein QLG25_13845 [Pseudomonas sp. CBR-F]